ncbi:hypothetical protein C2W62_36065 [Candidatus Entotheonella serta]|nr:hypothetical protein C2W62_36065 [Candidatus Entotheonella serta]
MTAVALSIRLVGNVSLIEQRAREPRSYESTRPAWCRHKTKTPREANKLFRYLQRLFFDVQLA